jgi:hypothetical protein
MKKFKYYKNTTEIMANLLSTQMVLQVMMSLRDDLSDNAKNLVLQGEDVSITALAVGS